MHIEEKELMEMALIGYGMQLARIDQQISEVRARLWIDSPIPGPSMADKDVPRFGKRRYISSAEGARIAAARRRSVAAYRNAKKAGRG